MTRRRYRLGRRAEAAEETRQRIIEATLQLHDHQGISSTSVRDVARSAGVAPATVLHHFPQMDHLIQACGALSEQLAPFPDVSLFAGAEMLTERVGRLAAALFTWWSAVGPGFDHLRIDRRRINIVDAWMSQVAQRHRDLAVAAIGDTDPARIGLLVALTTADAWAALQQSGMDVETAARHVADLIGLGDASPHPTTEARH